MPRPAFRDHCATLFAFYRTQGVVRPEGALLSAEQLFPGVAQVRMVYRMMGADDVAIAEWEHVQIVRRTDTWRVSLTIADVGLDRQGRSALKEPAAAEHDLSRYD